MIANLGPLLICASAAAIISVLTRDVRYLLGYVACGPWLIFNFFAVSDAPGTLSLYYAIPVRPGDDLAVSGPGVASRAVSPGRGRPTPAIFARPIVAHAACDRRSPAGVCRSTAAFATIPTVGHWWSGAGGAAAAADGGARAPGDAPGRLADAGSNRCRPRRRVAGPQSPFATSSSSTRTRCRSGFAPSPSTRVTMRPTAWSGSWSPTASSDRIASGFRRSISRSILRRTATRSHGRCGHSGGGTEIFEQSYLFAKLIRAHTTQPLGPYLYAGRRGLVVEGPFIDLAPGRYRIEYSVAAMDCLPRVDTTLDVAVRLDSAILARQSFDLDKIKREGDCSRRLPIEFTIGPGKSRRVEFPIWLVTDYRKVILRDLRLMKLS